MTTLERWTEADGWRSVTTTTYSEGVRFLLRCDIANQRHWRLRDNGRLWRVETGTGRVVEIPPAGPRKRTAR